MGCQINVASHGKAKGRVSAYLIGVRQHVPDFRIRTVRSLELIAASSLRKSKRLETQGSLFYRCLFGLHTAVSCQSPVPTRQPASCQRRKGSAPLTTPAPIPSLNAHHHDVGIPQAATPPPSFGYGSFIITRYFYEFTNLVVIAHVYVFPPTPTKAYHYY